MFTHTKSLFDMRTKLSPTAEKRVIIDMTSVLETYNARKVCNAGLVKSENDSAVIFTKNVLNEIHMSIATKNQLSHKIEL